ncbi:MAG TPA: hypothetical protein ENG42_01585 [Candidatus Aenigmarchaeota archaeon]|nr:MAG: hypothetical protein DRP03_01970 [Candidatus Aenigmarchaeota archaeon]HDD46142.1 hypothetical protein [Candidatus Aenigmarchaeota archaeon]
MNREYEIVGDEEYFRDNRLMEELGGDSPRNRVLDCLLINYGRPVDYEKISIAANMKPEAVREVIEELKGEGMVVEKEGSYMLNPDHSEVLRLLEIEAGVMFENIRKARKYYT